DAGSAPGGAAGLLGLRGTGQQSTTEQSPAADKPSEPGPDTASGEKPEGGTDDEVYRPEGIADDLVGENDRETIDRLMAKLGEQPSAPETPADYKLELEEGVSKLFGDTSDDPALKIFAEVAHENQLTDAQHNAIINQFWSKAVEAGVVDGPIDVDRELAALEPETGPAEERKSASTQRVVEAQNWVDSLPKRGILSKEQADVVVGLSATAAGVKIIEALRTGLDREKGTQAAKGAAEGRVTAEKIEQRRRDPRNDTRSHKFEQAFRDETDRLARELA
ncbi:MAG: hypothetical protein AAFQ35_14705, partial [Pseudomonadota bacterium]